MDLVLAADILPRPLIRTKRKLMKMVNKSLIMFDLDGTLVDSAPDLARCANMMLSQLQKPTYSEEHFRHWIGNGAKVMVQRALSGSSEISQELEPQAIEAALALFLQIYQDNVCVKTQLYDGVKSTLQQLRNQGLKLVIVTNKPHRFITPIINGVGISSMFDLLVGGDTVAQSKPHPQPLLYVCETLAIPQEQCIMVGDSKNDILAAKAANIQSIGLTYGYNYGEDIGLNQPEYVFSNFTDILTVM
jgi:phosphoglycolate phosphatase